MGEDEKNEEEGQVQFEEKVELGRFRKDMGEHVGVRVSVAEREA